MAKPIKQIILATTLIATGELVKERFISPKGKQATAGESVLGVAVHDAKAGDSVAVEAVGITLVEAGGAIAVGDGVVSDAQGCAVASAQNAIGVALSATTGAGELVKVLLR